MGRRHILAAIGLATLLLAYTIYWFALANIVRADIANWAEQRRALGFGVTYGEPAIGGFPFAVSARMSAPTISAPDGWWNWRSPDTELRVRPWAPFDLLFSAPGHHRLAIAGNPSREVSLDAPRLGYEIDIDRDNRVTGFFLDIADAALADPQAGVTRLASLVLASRLPNPPSSGSDLGSPDLSSLDLTLDAVGIELPPTAKTPLGPAIGKIHLVSQVMGRIPAGPAREALGAWRDAGGIIQLRESAIAWGPLGAKGEGTLALDQAMQPLAAGTVRIAGLGQTLSALSAAGVVDPQTATLAQMMFGVLARPPAEGGPPEVKLPLSIQDGLVNLGPIKLTEIPPIDWSQVP